MTQDLSDTQHVYQVEDKMLMCKPLPTHSRGEEDIFNPTDLYMAEKVLSWK
jgi:hypothetical protein